ncbi:hypothetical protein SCHPADRAFT_802315, partial [Schizopora paradoxa]
CYPGTRKAILTQVKEWAKKQDTKTPSIFWLRESGGTGKSAIAMSIAQWGFEEVNILGGGFFFDRQTPQCDLRSFTLTIVHDLALSDLSKITSIAQVLDDHRHNPEDLLASVLEKLDLRGPTLLLVDALDECDEEVAEKIISLLSTIPESAPQLRIFLTSRPESRIVDAFRRVDIHSLIEHNVNDSPHVDS